MAFDVGAVNQVTITAKDDTGPAFASATANLTKLAKDAETVGGFLKGSLSSLGIGFAADFLSSVIHAEAELGNLAARAGTTAESLSSMRIAAAESGVSLDQVATMMARLSKAVFEAQDGSTKAAQALQALGLDAKELVNLPTAQVLQAVVQALAGVRDGTAKTAIEMELLSRSGGEAAAFLKTLADNGVVAAQATNEQVEAAQQAERNSILFKDALHSLGVELVNFVVPSLLAFNAAAKGGNIQQSVGATLSTGLRDFSQSALASTDAGKAFLAWLQAAYPDQLRFGQSVTIGAEDLKNWGGEANRAKDSLRDLDGAMNAIAVDVSRLNSLIDQIEGKDLGIGGGFAASFKLLTDAFNTGLISLERYQQLTGQLLNQQPWAEKAAAAARQLAEAQQRLIDQQIQFLTGLHEETMQIGMTIAERLRYQDLIRGTTGAIEQEITERLRAIDAENQLKDALKSTADGWAANDAAMKQIEDDTNRYNDSLLQLDQSLQLQLDTLGMSTTEAQRWALQQQLAAAAANDNEIAVIRLTKAIETLDQIAAKQSVLDAQRAYEQAWKDTANSIERDLESAFDSAFKRGQSFGEALKNALDNMFKTLVLRPILQPIAGSITDVLAGLGLLSPSNKTAFGGGLPSLGDLSGGGINGGSDPITSLIRALFGSGGGGGFGMNDRGLGTSGIFSGLSSIGPFLPLLGLAIPLVSSLFNKSPSPVEGTFGIRGAGEPSSTFEDQASTLNRGLGLSVGFLDQGTQQFSGEAAQVFNKIVSGALDAFSSRLSGEDQAKLSDILRNTVFASFSGTFTTEDFLQKYGGQVLQQVVEAAFGVLDPALASVVHNFQGTADQVAQFSNTLLSLYDATKNLPASVQANIVGALDSTQETADKVLAFAQSLSLMVGPLAQLGQTMTTLASTDIPKLVDALGGAANYTNQMAFLFQNFTTSADKATLAGQQLQTALDALGEGSVQTHQQFIDAVNAALAAGDTQLAASLLNLEQLFIQVHGTADQAAGSVSNLTTAIAGLNDAIGPNNAGLSDFYTTQQKLANNTNLLNDDFAKLSVSVPQTHQDFLNLLSSIDRTTPAGEKLYEAIFALGPLFIQVHGTADQAAQSLNSAANALNNVSQAAQGVSLGDITNSAIKAAQKFLSGIDAILQNSTGDFGDKTGLKINLITDQITQLKAAAAAYLTTTGGIVDAQEQGYLDEIAFLQQTANQLSGQLAQFTTLKAQYGASIAEQLVQLQQWYNAQKQALGRNALPAELDALKQIFDQKWQDIVKGTSTGVNGVIDQLAKLRDGIAKYLQNLALGDLSPLTAQQKLDQSQSAYQLELTKALGGDQTALGDVSQFADAFLKQAADFYAVGSEAYTNVFNQVTQQLGGLAGTTPTGAPLQSGTAAIVSALPINGGAMASSEDITTLGNTLISKFEELITALANANTSDSAEVVTEIGSLESAVVGAIKDLATSGR